MKSQILQYIQNKSLYDCLVKMMISTQHKTTQSK